MGEQRTFGSMAWSHKGKVTRRERFLAEMAAVIPWGRLIAVIEPHYPKAGAGRQPLGLEKMLRIYFLQQWFNLSDPQAEDAIYDSESMRRFAGVELVTTWCPTRARFFGSAPAGEARADEGDLRGDRGAAGREAAVAAVGNDRGRHDHRGTELDEEREAIRDPEMKQTRKGKTWHFGMKLHVGTDLRGLVHTVRATHAGAADITQLPTCFTGKSGKSSAIRRTGNKPIDRPSRLAGCATE